MSLHKAPSGRWRAQVWDASKGRNVAVSQVLGPDYASFRTKAEAKAARELARKRLKHPTGGLTVADFRHRWLSDPLFARPKGSTMIHNGERTRPFAERYGSLPMRDVGDEIVGEWLAGGNRNGQVPALRAMWNDAASAKAGRVVESNPWAELGLKRTEGNKRKQPPPEDQVWEMIRYARELTSPYYAAWLQVAAFSGLRPGELDVLRHGPGYDADLGLHHSYVDFAAGRIYVNEQWNVKERRRTLPKNGLRREAPLTPAAREALLSLPRESNESGGWWFENTRGGHWTPSARAYHWKAVRAAAGWKGACTWRRATSPAGS